jgi:preprotein translocase subunit SecB
MAKTAKKSYKLHAIQLLSLDVLELSIKVNRPPTSTEQTRKETFSLSCAHGEYDAKGHMIRVRVKLEKGLEENTDEPFSLRIVLGGMFKIDETKFPIEHVNDWANRNAVLILYPYIREHAFSLTARCGFKPLILPLLEVPTLQTKRPTRPKP